LEGRDVSPFLKIALFQLEGYLLCCEDLLNILNKYFSSISKLDEEYVTLLQFDSKTNNIIHEIHITENEIIDVIQILDPNKATGPDKISHKMLKISPDKITKPLLIIFNKSSQQSKYPSNWKSAF
jgi:hypothetical protein